MAALRTFVHVTDEHGRAHSFGPGDDVPAWAVTKITNPKAWAERPAEDVDEVDDESPVEGPAEESMEQPPKAGPGSGKDAWVAYAATKGVAEADLDGLTRDQIIELFQES